MGDKSAEFSFYVTNEKAATEICAGRRCESVARSVVYGVIVHSSTTRELVLYIPSTKGSHIPPYENENHRLKSAASWISCPWILPVKTRETTFTKATQSWIQIRNYKHQFCREILPCPSQKHPTIAMWVPDSCQKLQGFSRGEVEDWCILFSFNGIVLPASLTWNLKWWFPKGISYSRVPFSGSMLNFGRAYSVLFCSLFCFLFSVFCFVFSIPSSHIIVLSNHVTSNRIISCQIISHHNVTYIYMYIYIYIYACIYLQKKNCCMPIERTMLKSLFKTVRSVISTDHQLRLFHNFGAPNNKKNMHLSEALPCRVQSRP